MRKKLLSLVSAALIAAGLIEPARAAGTKVALDENGVMQIDGKKTFVFSFSLPPPPVGKTPEGNDAFAELKDAGVNFMRIRPSAGAEVFTEAGIRSIKPWLDAAAGQQMHCWVTLGKLPAIKPDEPENEKLLRLAIELYKDHP